jgi:Acetyltransferase (isoleucine patch superfamily)
MRFLKGSKIDRNCFFEGYNSVGERTRLSNCYFGQGSYVGRSNELSSVQIGKFCSIGSFIINATGRHPSSVFVSTHPAFFSEGKAAGFTFINKTKFKELHYVEQNYLISIGNDVWIGDRVTIFDGIKIGDGAIIGAGSIVTKDIEPYTINVGIPAKPIKKRFTDEQIQWLLKFKWWDRDLDWIKENAELFDKIEKFMKNYYED